MNTPSDWAIKAAAHLLGCATDNTGGYLGPTLPTSGTPVFALARALDAARAEGVKHGREGAAFSDLLRDFDRITAERDEARAVLAQALGTGWKNGAVLTNITYRKGLERAALLLRGMAIQDRGLGSDGVAFDLAEKIILAERDADLREKP